MRVSLIKSPLKTKKWRVLFEGTHVDFGAIGYSDFTIHGDSKRMKRYLVRHSSREDWTDMKTAGFWSRWLLWSRPSLREAKTFMSRKFKLKFV